MYQMEEADDNSMYTEFYTDLEQYMISQQGTSAPPQKFVQTQHQHTYHPTHASPAQNPRYMQVLQPHQRGPHVGHDRNQQIMQVAASSSTNAMPIKQNSSPKYSDGVDLSCDEDILGSSPSTFVEYVPGAWDVVRQNRSLIQGKSAMRFRTELDASDVKLVNELGQLSVDHLLDYMKNLQNNAFLLGEEESKEFQRTKCLGVFNAVIER